MKKNIVIKYVSYTIIILIGFVPVLMTLFNIKDPFQNDDSFFVAIVKCLPSIIATIIIGLPITKLTMKKLYKKN